MPCWPAAVGGALLASWAVVADPGAAAESPAATTRQHPFGDVRATYNAAPRRSDGRVDAPRLLGELATLRANTYNWLIWHAATDWDDLKSFLPSARQAGLCVWVSLVPPSESPPISGRNYSEPFRLDYERWAVEIATLSLAETNLVAWSIDDFTHNLKVFTPAHLGKIRESFRRVNPSLAFVPCCYFSGITASFVTNYSSLIDGILFPYRHESGGANLKDASLVEPEVRRIRDLTGGKLPIVLDIYATAHSRLGASAPEYLDAAMVAGRRCAAGVMIYCHQDPRKNADKFELIKRRFGEWAAESKPDR